MGGPDELRLVPHKAKREPKNRPGPRDRPGPDSQFLFLDISRNFSEMSRNFLEMSKKLLEISKKFLEISRNFIEISRKFLDISLYFPRKFWKFPCDFRFPKKFGTKNRGLTFLRL